MARRTRPSCGSQLRRQCAALVVAAAPLLHSVREASAFDAEGHDAQGQTAASAMDQEAIRQVKRLLGGKDAADVAAWGHEVDDTFPAVARMHFQVHGDRGESLPQCQAGLSKGAKVDCPDGICLVESIKHFYGKILQDEGRRLEFPQIDYRKVGGVSFSDVDAVKMLINLIGDLHQPFHVGFAADGSGKDVQVEFNGQQMSLYDLWDKGISEFVRTKNPNFWLGGWTHFGSVRSEHEADKKQWEEEGAFKSFEKWLDESVQLACELSHRLPKGPGPHKVDQVVASDWKEKWLNQVLMAGQRTAIVLNDILDAQGAKMLDMRTKVKTEADLKLEREYKEIDRVRRKNPKLYQKKPWFDAGALGTNLMIAAVTVPLWLLWVNFGLNPHAWYGMVLQLLEPADKKAARAAAEAQQPTAAPGWTGGATKRRAE